MMCTAFWFQYACYSQTLMNRTEYRLQRCSQIARASRYLGSIVEAHFIPPSRLGVGTTRFLFHHLRLPICSNLEAFSRNQQVSLITDSDNPKLIS